MVGAEAVAMVLVPQLLNILDALVLEDGGTEAEAVAALNWSAGMGDSSPGANSPSTGPQPVVPHPAAGAAAVVTAVPPYCGTSRASSAALSGSFAFLIVPA